MKQVTDKKEEIKDIENAVALTLKRAIALGKIYQTQIEDKDVINYETEDKLKMLIFNLCREIKQIFVIFLASPEFNPGAAVDNYKEEEKIQSSSW